VILVADEHCNRTFVFLGFFERDGSARGVGVAFNEIVIDAARI